MPSAVEQPLEISPLAVRLGPKRMLVDIALPSANTVAAANLDDPKPVDQLRYERAGVPPRERRWRWLSAATRRRDSRCLSRVDPPGLVVAGCTRYCSAPGSAQPGQGRPMNVPGFVKGNWRWRANRHMLSAREFQALGDLTKFSNRSASVQLLSMEAAS